MTGPAPDQSRKHGVAAALVDLAVITMGGVLGLLAVLIASGHVIVSWR